eukprot:14132-Heterococcus_DN1.PRE.1
MTLAVSVNTLVIRWYAKTALRSEALSQRMLRCIRACTTAVVCDSDSAGYSVIVTPHANGSVHAASKHYKYNSSRDCFMKAVEC